MGGFDYNSARQRDLIRLFPDLIRARELLLDLIWKDLRARYRYALMGFLWAVIEPLALMLVLTFVFSVLFRFSGREVGERGAGPDFAVMLLCGLIFWQYLSSALTGATRSLVDNQHLVKKVYFAREVIPLAAIFFPLIYLGIGFLVLLGVHLIRGGMLGMGLLWFPFVFGIQLALTAGLSLFLSSAFVLYRDIGHIVTMGVTFGFYGTPIFYPLELVERAVEKGAVPDWFMTLYLVNPMAGLVTAYRQILFDLRFPDLTLLVWPLCAALLSLVLGALLFRRTGPTLSDYL
jgi:lipopolysaccharide transport system permease protein